MGMGLLNNRERNLMPGRDIDLCDVNRADDAATPTVSQIGSSAGCVQ